MTETKEYPLPTVHMNGTPKETLYKGNIHIIQAINELEESINACTFHGRDYYLADEDPYSYGTYNKALVERQKHLAALCAFKNYIEDHINHIDGQ